LDWHLACAVLVIQLHMMQKKIWLLLTLLSDAKLLSGNFAYDAKSSIEPMHGIDA
jgi:hypothetical protein